MTIKYLDSKRISLLEADRELVQGYAGGDGSASDAGGGGGGSSSVGQTAPSNSEGGDGGAGTANPIVGSSAGVSGYLAGGGGGNTSGGTGGSGGGGNGSTGMNDNASNATGYGSGGGGSRNSGNGGGNSGSGSNGIVIIKFVTSGNGYSQAGGTVDSSSSAGNTIITYTATSGTTFTPTSAFDIQYLIVAGGAGGGVWVGGGGGAGGLRTDTDYGVTAQTYTITVGAGGAGQTGGGGGKLGISGGNSSINSIISTGGGGGGASTFTASTGGSGGGGREGQTGASSTGIDITPTNVQDNSILVEKDTGRRYWRTGALAPTYEDDFSTDTLGANTTDATYIDWDGSGAIDLIAPVSVNTGGGDSGWFDLTTVSDSANVVRFSLDTSAITVGAVPQMWIGLSSIGTGDSTTTNDWFGMYIQAAAGNPIILAGHANGVGCNNLSSDSTFTKTLAVEKIWVEIIRTSTTAFTLNIFSDEYVTLTESKTGVTTSVTSTTNFRMITRNHNGASAGFTMKLGDLEFYNGVTSATPATWTGNFDLTGLKAYWKFDETSGDIINQATSVGSTDSLGSGADGQNSGADYGAVGLLGEALSFVDGTSDIVVVGTSKSQFNFMWNTSMKFTLVFWYKHTTIPSGQTDIFTSVDSDHNNKGMGCQFRANRALNVQIGNVAVDFTTSSNFLPNDTSNFHMIVVTGDYNTSPQMTISVDNGTPETKALTGSLSSVNSTNVQSIGSSAGTYPLEMDGRLDEMSVWNRVLTSAEITTLYNSGRGKAVY